jgi:excisionase family DNA binding protein
MNRGINLTPKEITSTFSGPDGEKYSPIISTCQVAEMLGLSRKTIDDWIAKGRLNGTFRKRGKHNLFWRDRVITAIFNGGHWTNGAPTIANRRRRQDQADDSRQKTQQAHPVLARQLLVPNLQQPRLERKQTP